jgi:hypothetical protein
MRAGALAGTSSVFTHSLGYLVADGRVFEQVQLVEVQPKAATFRTVVYFDTAVFAFVQRYVTVRAVHSQSSPHPQERLGK